MNKLKSFFLIFACSIFAAAMLLPAATAQQSKWVTYHGDFCSFDVPSHYELDYQQRGKNFRYFLYSSENPDKKLELSSRHMKMEFKLESKKGYETQYSGVIKVKNSQGVERKGVTPDETHWREAYIYKSIRGPLGPDTSLIYAAYDDVDGEQSIIFNKIMESIEVKDSIKVDVTPGFQQ